MRHDKISIIMPCFNAERYISGSVASALGQTYQDIELIVINDGSADRSLHILHGIDDPRLKIITQQNKGVCAARNRGLYEATGAYIAFLDADDTWKYDCLEKLYSALKSGPGPVLSYCGWQNVGLPEGQGMPYIPPDYEAEGKLEFLLKSCPWPIHAALTLKSAIDSSGGFDEHYSNAEDYKLWLRIASFSRIVRVPDVLAFYHFHDGHQASRSRAQAAYQQWLVQKEFIEKYHEVVRQLGYSRIRQLTIGGLLKSGYVCYWGRNLEAARQIFRLVMKQGYGTLNDWKYMLPSLLPMSLHRGIIKLFEKNKKTVPA
jgi:glycosyltransferase involved in cell wall biosynthesis